MLTFKEMLKASKRMPEPEWNQLEPSLVFVHDKMSHSFVMELLPGNATRSEKYNGMTARETFRSRNEQLANDEKLEKLAELHDPVEADVYCRPRRR